MKAKKIRRTFNCSFCGKNRDQVQRIIAGPGGVYICDECVDLISKENAGQQKETNAIAKTGGAAVTNRCCFCGKKQQQVLYVHTSRAGVNICSECIDLCREIISDEASHC